MKGTPGKRPPRAAVEQMLAGQHLDVAQQELTEDVNGDPLGVERVPDKEMSGIPAEMSLSAYGWTQAEWADTSITE